MSSAYAVVLSGEILVNTIYEDERGAQVNGLGIVFGVMPMRDWTTERIAKTWKGFSDLASFDVAVVKVAVEVIQ